MEALGVMVEVIFYLVVDGVLESCPSGVELVLRSQSTNSDARRWLTALSILAGTSTTQLVEPVTPQTDMLIMSWDLPGLIRLASTGT
jgi:hypothetical protein